MPTPCGWHDLARTASYLAEAELVVIILEATTGRLMGVPYCSQLCKVAALVGGSKYCGRFHGLAPARKVRLSLIRGSGAHPTDYHSSSNRQRSASTGEISGLAVCRAGNPITRAA